MNKTTKISIIAAITIAVLALLVYALNSTQNKGIKDPVVTQQPAPTTVIPAPQAPQDPTTKIEPLTPLPIDNKQAIDSELQGIDQSLTASEPALSEAIQDEELGL